MEIVKGFSAIWTKLDGHGSPVESGGGKWTLMSCLIKNGGSFLCENEKCWSIETSSSINCRPFWTLGFPKNVGKIDENESEIISNESDEFSAASSMFCGTVITGLFELGVSHLDLEVSKFNFWSLKFFLFDVVFSYVSFFRPKSTWERGILEQNCILSLNFLF